VTPDGTVTEIAAPGTGTTVNTGTLANDINANGVVAGVIVGTGNNHSFMRAADGTFTMFDPPGTGTGGSTANSINDDGVIAGSYSDANNLSHGYIRAADGAFETVDEPMLRRRRIVWGRLSRGSMRVAQSWANTLTLLA